MHILLTNDDGVQAPGLLALAQSLRRLGKVTILAPDHNWSASGHVKTLSRPMRVRPVQLADGSEALCSDGAPSDCVALALLGLVKDVDWVVSGVNPHANVGQDLTYSGTVTAALEGVIFGLPAMAVSLDGEHVGKRPEDYAVAAEIAYRLLSAAPQRVLPPGIGLNVNVPNLPLDELSGLRITRQGRRIYRDALVTRTDPRGIPYYWIGGEAPVGEGDAQTDIGALAQGYVSITPLHLNLTANQAIPALENWLGSLGDK